jgi:hypothetical protein
MPTLKHLLEELRRIKVDPDEVRIPGQLYDDLLSTPKTSLKKTQLKRRIESPLLRISPAGGLFRGKEGMMVYDYGSYKWQNVTICAT